MQYSDELIKQELMRYSITNSPDVSEEEVARWKETFVTLDNKKIRESLEYIHGRSWFWRKLMESADILPIANVGEVMAQIDAIKGFHPEFEIGIQVAMRMMGKPIMDSRIERLEDSKIEEAESVHLDSDPSVMPKFIEPEPEEKPKPKRSRKKKT